MSPAIVLAVLAAVAAGRALMDLAQLPKRTDIDAPRRAGDADSSGGGGTGATATRRWAADVGSDGALEALLDAAGRVAVPDAAALGARRRLGGMIGAAWGGAVGLLLAPAPMALAIAALGLLGGRHLPAILLRRAGAQRQGRLADECPELLELLAAALGCGLPVQGALEATGRWSSGELSVGTRRAAADLTRGAAVDPTLSRLAREYPAPELQAAIAILWRSRVNGTPAAEPLRALATASRHARARRAMEHAARAAPRVQLVAALLLVPAALCVLGAAVVAGGTV